MSKTIVVIGAGPGVGLAVAKRFGGEGFNVALIARSADSLRDLTGQLEKTGVKTAAFRADVLDRSSLTAALEAATSHFGSIDVLEYGPTPPFDSMRGPRDIDIDIEQYHFDLQVLGAIAAVRTVLPGMLHRKSGSLLFTTAASAQHPAVVTGSFGVAAGALLNYVRLLNIDLASAGIYAGMVSIAGLVVSPGKSSAEATLDFPPGIPLLNPDDIAELHWRLHLDRDRAEVFAGDIQALLANKQLY